ncbi:MAG: hypothetical protein COA81_11225 [Alphaproteobacteria bacterium]|nr:MAG: hypothetical protein COA81_11225 [Alphaproteobacteria bacterium]
MCDYFSRTMPRNTHEVRDYIRRIHGYGFSHSGVIKLMHRLGFVYRRPCLLPAGAILAFFSRTVPKKWP